MKIFDWLDGIEVTVVAIVAALLLISVRFSSRIDLPWLIATGLRWRRTSRMQTAMQQIHSAPVSVAKS